MSIEIIIIFVILCAAVVLFVTEWLSFDVTALLILISLVLTGILSVGEALTGFSNEATITIGAMFVLSEGVNRTGALNSVTDYLPALGRKNYWVAVGAMMLVVGIISAFINNTAAVAIFIPVIISAARDLDVAPSKLLMPLSFASMFGGACTLIGTSTNILVSSIAEKNGLEPFSIFEFTPLGIVFFVLGLAYMYFVGIRLIPAREAEGEATERYGMGGYLTDVQLRDDSVCLGQSVNAGDLTNDLDLDVLQVYRADGRLAEEQDPVFQQGDTLRIRGNPEEISKLQTREGVSLKSARSWEDADLETVNDVLVEAVVAPDSGLQGKRIADVNFLERFNAILLAVRRRDELQQDDMEQLTLSGGDSLLLNMPRNQTDDVRRDPSFVLISEVGLPDYRKSKMPLALAIMGGVVLAMTSGAVPVVIAALTGCLLMIITGCLLIDEVYNVINWKVIFLLAGVLPLGTAMEKTEAAMLISDYVLGWGQSWGPTAVVSAFFLLSMMLTNIISNQATAALLAPVAIQTAGTMGINARPLLMAITFAASLSFMTPVGYQTNTLIYGPGQYKFTDFTRVGTPLNILFWITATIMIPIIWPF